MANKLDNGNEGSSNDDIYMPSESLHKLHSLTLAQPEASGIHELAVDRKFFRVRLADTENHRSSASMLIKKMYSWRGYGSSIATENEHPNRITLVASNDDTPIGTITSAFDSEIGLLADELYKQELDQARKQERSVCEFIKLAIDRGAGSKMMLASLFHLSYIYARVLNRVDDLFIEVNPRHASFYKRMLGFKRAGAEKLCIRVNAPAVLLRLDFAWADEQIARLGGKAGRVFGEKSLYPYFFSKKEEEGMVKRITQIN